jgi:hypothetical protein
LSSFDIGYDWAATRGNRFKQISRNASRIGYTDLKVSIL